MPIVFNCTSNIYILMISDLKLSCAEMKGNIDCDDKFKSEQSTTF